MAVKSIGRQQTSQSSMKLSPAIQRAKVDHYGYGLTTVRAIGGHLFGQIHRKQSPKANPGPKLDPGMTIGLRRKL